MKPWLACFREEEGVQPIQQLSISPPARLFLLYIYPPRLEEVPGHGYGFTVWLLKVSLFLNFVPAQMLLVCQVVSNVFTWGCLQWRWKLKKVRKSGSARKVRSKPKRSFSSGKSSGSKNPRRGNRGLLSWGWRRINTAGPSKHWWRMSEFYDRYYQVHDIRRPGSNYYLCTQMWRMLSL